MASLVLRVKMKIISTMTIVCIITGQSKIPKRRRYPPKKLAIRRMITAPISPCLRMNVIMRPKTMLMIVWYIVPPNDICILRKMKLIGFK